MAGRVPRAPWFQALGGLNFKCTACGKCCSKKSGIVRVNLVEIDMLSELKQMSTEDFSQKYIRVIEEEAKGRPKEEGRGLALKNNEDDSACIFLDQQTKKCTVYSARPTQCRTFPFWPELVVSPFDWEVASKECEGISFTPHSASAAAATVTASMTSTPVAAVAAAAAAAATDSSALQEETNLISPQTIVEEMLIHTVHGEEDAVETTYSFGRELVEEIDPGLVDSFREEFFDTHYRTVVYEDTDVLVLDTVTPDAPRRRSLVFKDSITHTQTELNCITTTHDNKQGSEEEVSEFDHSSLVLPVHQAMMCIPAVVGNVYVMGVGGGAIPMYMKHLVPDVEMCIVDNSAKVIKIAQEYFGLKGVNLIKSAAETYLSSVRGAARIVLDIASRWAEDGSGLLSALSLGSLRSPDGMLIANLLLPPEQIGSRERVHGLRWLEQLQQITPHVVVLVLNHNAVFYCSVESAVDQLTMVRRKSQRERWGQVYDAEEFRAWCKSDEQAS